MGFFDFLKDDNHDEHLEERAYFGGNTTLQSIYTLSDISEDQVMRIPAVQSIMDIICGTIAQLPIYLYKENETDGSVDKIPNDNRTYLLNQEPNPSQTAFNYKRDMVKDYLLYGSHYSYKEMSRNDVIALYGLATGNLTMKIYRKHGFKVENVDIVSNQNNIQDTFKQHELMAVLKDSKDGITSKGALYYGQDIFSIINEEIFYSQSIYRNGVLPLGVLQSKGRLTEPVIKRLRDSWSNLYSGSRNAGKTVILEEGLEYKPISLNPRDLLLNENKRDNISDICRLFNIPESLVNSDANKYGSLEQNNIFFLQYTLSPIITSIENALNKSLLLEDEKEDGYFFAFDTSEVLRTTEKEKFESIKVGLDAGVITMNEARYKLNLKGINDDIMKWSLGSVLFYPATGEMKIPNMGIGIDGAKNENGVDNTSKNNISNNINKGEKIDGQDNESSANDTSTSSK